MNEYEEYVQPPSYSYTNNERDDDVDPLIKKLRVRIQQDLNQINGVYDSQISECDKNKLKKQKQIDLEYSVKIEHINNQRNIEISLYNVKHITTWWKYFFAKLHNDLYRVPNLFLSYRMYHFYLKMLVKYKMVHCFL